MNFINFNSVDSLVIRKSFGVVIHQSKTSIKQQFRTFLKNQEIKFSDFETILKEYFDLIANYIEAILRKEF